MRCMQLRLLNECHDYDDAVEKMARSYAALFGAVLRNDGMGNLLGSGAAADSIGMAKWNAAGSCFKEGGDSASDNAGEMQREER